MRILIDDHDRTTFPLPWTSDGTCFSFKAPKKTISPDRIEIKRPSYVEVLVIGCNISDYQFVSKMKNLKQLYIYRGENLTDLSFIQDLVYLQHICICESHVSSMHPLIELIEKKYILYKDMPEGKELEGRLQYGIDGLFVHTDAYDGDASVFLKSDICRSDITLNRQRITFREIMRNPEYKEILRKSQGGNCNA